MNTLTEHLQEYYKQLDQAERQAAAVRGAIQALERLQKEYIAEQTDEENSPKAVVQSKTKKE